MTTDEAICVHCRAPAGRPVATEGSWLCHGCRQWQPWRDRLNDKQYRARVLADAVRLRAYVAVLRAKLDGANREIRRQRLRADALEPGWSVKWDRRLSREKELGAEVARLRAALEDAAGYLHGEWCGAADAIHYGPCAEARAALDARGASAAAEATDALS